jgi:hypothetical protein
VLLGRKNDQVNAIFGPFIVRRTPILEQTMAFLVLESFFLYLHRAFKVLKSNPPPMRMRELKVLEKVVRTGPS